MIFKTGDLIHVTYNEFGNSWINDLACKCPQIKSVLLGITGLIESLKFHVLE
jgi:hypothetical protein